MRTDNKIQRIKSKEELKEFWLEHDGQWVLDQLKNIKTDHRKFAHLLVPWPVGAGKSTNIDQILDIAHSNAINNDSVSYAYDVTIYIAPLNKIIDERRIVKMYLGKGKIISEDKTILRLRARPSKKCESFDTEWKSLEKRSLGVYGKTELCNKCLNYDECDWHKQYTQGIKAAKIIFATHAHIKLIPDLIDYIRRTKQISSSSRVLLIVDEIDFICQPFGKIVRKNDIVTYKRALVDLRDDLTNSNITGTHVDIDNKIEQQLVTINSSISACDLLLSRKNPQHINKSVNDYANEYKLQTIFSNIQGGVYPGQDLRYIQQSGICWFTKSDNVFYVFRPQVNCDCIVYSGSVSKDFINARLALGGSDKFVNTDNIGKTGQRVKFSYRGTTWFNIKSRIGAKAYYQKNEGAILEFFASVVAKLVKADKPPLLIAAKSLCEGIAKNLNSKLNKIKCDAEVLYVKDNAALKEFKQRTTTISKHVLPLIHYGTSGINTYKKFSAALCLSNYNIPPQAIKSILRDHLEPGKPYRHKSIDVVLKKDGSEREFGPQDANKRLSSSSYLAKLAHETLEKGVVLQAVGRVRPFTNKRLVILFQEAHFPMVSFEFKNLKEARDYFGIRTVYNEKINKSKELAIKLYSEGKSNSEIASETGKAPRTVRGYLQNGRLAKKP